MHDSRVSVNFDIRHCNRTSNTRMCELEHSNVILFFIHTVAHITTTCTVHKDVRLKTRSRPARPPLLPHPLRHLAAARRGLLRSPKTRVILAFDRSKSQCDLTQIMYSQSTKRFLLCFITHTTRTVPSFILVLVYMF